MDESKLIQLCEDIASIKTSLESIEKNLKDKVGRAECEKAQVKNKYEMLKRIVGWLLASGFGAGAIKGIEHLL